MPNYILREMFVYRSTEHAESEVFDIPDNAQIVRVQGAYEELEASTREKTGKLSYIVTYAIKVEDDNE